MPKPDEASKPTVKVLEERPPRPPEPRMEGGMAESAARTVLPLIGGGCLFVVVFVVALAAGAWFVWLPEHEPEAAVGGSVLVLPFVGQNERDIALADTLTVEVIAALSAESLLEVAPRSEALAYAQDPRGIVEIGQDAGVRYVVDGAVRAGEDGGARVDIHLSDAQAGALVLERSFTVSEADLGALDDRIADAVREGTGLAAPETPAPPPDENPAPPPAESPAPPAAPATP